MRKSNIITILSFVILIAAVVGFRFLSTASSAIEDVSSIKETQSTVNNEDLTEETTAAAMENIPDTAEPTEDMTAKAPEEGASDTMAPEENKTGMSLFIGDSRTVGLFEYGQIENADFFCNVGMSVYNIHDKTLSVAAVGKVTLIELLNCKKYDTIYIMLGINELGYNLEKSVGKYNELTELIKEKQPQANIVLQANLHVTKSRSETDKVINNGAIDRFNDAVSQLAGGGKTFYVDANDLFDDEEGNLSSDKSEDNAHLYAKYYTQWGKWISDKTAELIKED